MKRAVAIVAFGAAVVLASFTVAGNSPPAGHGILLLGHDPDAARIFLWRPGSPVEPVTGPQRWGTSGGGGMFSGMSDGFWSPDGSSIAFEQDTPGGLAPPDTSIAVVRPDGTHLKPLSSGTSEGDGAADSGFLPSWSPDSRHLVWLREIDGVSDYVWQLVLVDVSNGHERVWPGDPVRSDPVWGKPGIAYASDAGIMLLNPTTGNARLLTRRFDSGRLAWSPGGVLAVGVPGRIVLLDASGRQVGSLPLPPEARSPCAIAWAPQSARILVATARGKLQMWVGTVSTKHWQRLPRVPTWRNYRYDPWGYYPHSCAVSWR